MVKEYLDFLYENRAELQQEIDTIVKKQSLPISQCCDNMEYINSYKIQLEEVRDSIYRTNKSIEKYIELHN